MITVKLFMSYLKSIREAFAHKSFFWLFFATSISLIGTQSLNYGFQAHLFALTKDNALLGFNNFMFYGAMLISLIFGGVVGDSYPKKKLLLLAESLSIPLCLFLLTDLSPKTLIFLKALLAFVSSFLIPLRLSYIKTIFKNKNIKTMVSLFSITQYSAMLLGPAIGTYLYEFFQSWKLIVLLDSGSFVLGLSLIHI